MESTNTAKGAKAGADSQSDVHLGRLQDAPGFLLRRANVVFRLHYAAYFKDKDLGVTPVIGSMMILIEENPGITQIELARLLKIEGSTLWQSVTRLVELEYIQRYRVETDKRAYALHLSRAGRTALRKIEEGMKIHQKALLQVLSADERTLLMDMLMRIIQRGEEILKID